MPLDHGLTDLAVTQLLVNRDPGTTHQTLSSSPNRCAAALGTCPASTHALQFDCIQGCCNRLPVAGQTVQQPHLARLPWHVCASTAVRAATACLSQNWPQCVFLVAGTRHLGNQSIPCMISTHDESATAEAQASQLLARTADAYATAQGTQPGVGVLGGLGFVVRGLPEP
jgi:hypothetical protein